MNIEEMLSEIIDRVTRIEERLNDRYRFKVDETSINNYLNDIDEESLHMITCDDVYKAYCQTCEYPASKRKLNNAIKTKFSNITMKHTTKLGNNIYYWYLEDKGE